MKSYINLGCGCHYHPAWTNFDLVPQGPGVIGADLIRGIPLPDANADVVYHSSVLEHIRREDVPIFLAECCRVLKPGGIIRVAVPDLERICRLYLQKLELALAGDSTAASDYEWLMLELFDQIVRERSGGGMRDYLRQPGIPNEDFVYERIGEEGRKLVAELKGYGSWAPRSLSVVRLLRYSLRLVAAARRASAGLLLSPRERLALRMGRFRLSGEVHHWMYDRFSLAVALEAAGFIEPSVFAASASRIPNWGRYGLDALPDGTAIKPDLFYLEARKPKNEADTKRRNARISCR